MPLQSLCRDALNDRPHLSIVSALLQEPERYVVTWSEGGFACIEICDETRARVLKFNHPGATLRPVKK